MLEKGCWRERDPGGAGEKGCGLLSELASEDRPECLEDGWFGSDVEGRRFGRSGPEGS